jgi:putative membrane protein
MLKRLTGIALVGVMIAAPAVGSAQTSSQGTSKQATSKEAKTPRGDQRFVKEVLGDGMAEVQLGQLAQQRGSSDAVKQFGQRMATDHGKAGDELKQLASQKGIEAPTALDRSHQRTYDRLAKLSGADFDRAYMKEMVKDHDKDVKAFQKEANSGSDPDIKAWASKTLSTLQDHQQQAKQVQASVSGKTSPAASPRTK